MKAILLKEAIPTLHKIGSITLLGSTVIEGDPQASALSTLGEPSDNLNGGYFACTHGKFSMTYPFTEYATVLSGSLALTNELTGERTVYGPGDSWIVEKGTPVTWEVLSDEFVKHYLACVNP
ncbi:cupin domain-containing protein [Thorsellia kenyensis]|uniref:Cupin domain-containing protein n=1 Tax=Thorsellia kenyensis TaxID=1549888 RepID=A0ABV6CB28_9GAMM